MNLVEVLRRQAAERPDAPAIIEGAADALQALTFAGLERETARVAGLLRERGVDRGDTVLIVHPMAATLYVFLLALLRIGGVAGFLDPSAGRDHVARCCRRRPPAALFASRRAHWLRLVVPALRAIPRKFSCGGWVPGATDIDVGAAPHARVEPVDADHPALITFTSGSTGEPKAVVRSHGFLLAQHAVLARHLHYEAGERDLTTLPVFVLANLASGVTTVLPDADLRRVGAIEPAPVVRQLAATHATRTAASPAFLERLCDHVEASGTPVAAMRRVFVGGAPVFPNFLERARRCFPNAEVTAVYGSTEAEPIAHVDASAIADTDMDAMRAGKGLLAGAPVREIALRIVRARCGAPLGRLSAAAFDALSMAPGEVGEIVVHGAHVVRGYLDGIGDEETKFDVGDARWHRTGDLGWLDADGRLWLMGRAGARVEDERGVLYPFAVECAAQQLPGVRRAALLSDGGRRLLAVEGPPGARPDAQALRAALAWAQLDDVIVLERIPLDARHNAKVDYPALRKALGG